MRVSRGFAALPPRDLVDAASLDDAAALPDAVLASAFVLERLDFVATAAVFVFLAALDARDFLLRLGAGGSMLFSSAHRNSVAVSGLCSMDKGATAAEDLLLRLTLERRLLGGFDEAATSASCCCK